MQTRFLFSIFVLATASSLAVGGAACGSDGGAPANPDASVGGDAASEDGALTGDATTAVDAGGGDGATRCARTLGPADGARRVVVSHPFDKDGNKATGFELLTLSTAGQLTRANVTFQMGTALDSDIAFTPDGDVILVAQDDGTVGVARFDATGVTVVHAAFKGAFYAGKVVMDPRGDRAYVLDADTAGNKGGVYLVDIACDGTLTDRGLIVPGGTAFAMTIAPGSTQAVLSAGAAFNSPAAADTELVELGDSGSLVASGSAFPEGGAIVSDIAVAHSGKFALLADNGINVGNRIAIVDLPTLAPRGVLAVPNPAAIVASPFDDTALVLSSDGVDGIRLAHYTPDAAAPFTIGPEITYVNGKPQLPSFASLVTRGALTGLVLVAENTAVRLVQLHDDAGATDVAILTFGADSTSIVGVIGAQP